MFAPGSSFGAVYALLADVDPVKGWSALWDLASGECASKPLRRALYTVQGF